MGEVYKARDTRLDRTVAIKILPAETQRRPRPPARFEREARTIAGLNHPHICTLHDVGEHGDSTYLVMEHLAGETLAERLQKGRLPPDQALDGGDGDRRRARGRAPAGDHPSRPEARQRDADEGRGEAARLRPGEAGRAWR